MLSHGIAVRELTPVVSPLEAAFLALTEAPAEKPPVEKAPAEKTPVEKAPAETAAEGEGRAETAVQGEGRAAAETAVSAEPSPEAAA